MSVNTITRQPVPYCFNGKDVMIQPVTTLQTLRIIGIINRLKSKMGLDKDSMSKINLSTSGIITLFGKILEGISEDINTNDYENAEDFKLKGLPLTVFSEVANTAVYTTGAKLTAMDVASAPLDDTVGLLVAIAKAEAETSLGKRILAMYEKAAKVVRGVISTMESPLTSGGLPNGGQTSLSTLSEENTDGQKITS